MEKIIINNILNRKILELDRKNLGLGKSPSPTRLMSNIFIGKWDR